MDRQEIMTKTAAWMHDRGWKQKIANRLLARTDGLGDTQSQAPRPHHAVTRRAGEQSGVEGVLWKRFAVACRRVAAKKVNKVCLTRKRRETGKV